MRGAAIQIVRFLAVVLCGAMLLGGRPAIAEPVQIRTAPHEGYGRIVFNWQAAVPYTAELNDNRLTITFGRPLEANVGATVRTLSRYLRSGEIGNGGRTVTFVTTGEFGLRSFDLGQAVVVDLLDGAASPAPASQPAAQATPVGAPPAPAPAASEPPRSDVPSLGVRSGEHEGYSRIVFDWPSRVGYSVDRAGGTLTLSFDRAARPDLGGIRSRLPEFVAGIDATVRDDGLTVSLQVPETSRIRHFRSGPKVAVDVMAPATASAAAPRAAPTAQPQPVPAPAQPAAADKPEAPETPAPGEQASEPSPAAEPQPAPAEPAATEPPAAEQVASKPRSLVPVKPGVLTPPPAAEGMARPTPLTPANPQALDPIATAAALAAATQAGGAQAAPEGAVTLRFEWGEPVAAAVFRRGGSLWIAFDKAKTVDIAALKAAAGNTIRTIESVPVTDATVLRMETVSGVNPSLRRDGLAWLFDFKLQPLQPQSPIETQAQPNSTAGARLFLPVPQPGNAVAIPDPEVGDTVVAVPVIPLGHGVAERHEYPQVDILPTGQGIAVVPAIDTLRVRPLRQGVELTSTDTLHISPVPALAAAGNKLGATRALTRILDLDKWRKISKDDFLDQKRRLQTAAALAEGPNRERARMNMARFFVAQGYGAEALGVLRNVGRDRPGVLNDPEFRALQGSSNFLMARYTDASEDWYHQSLNNNDEATFWRASFAAQKGDYIQASRVLRVTGSVLRQYPKALMIPLALTAAESAIQVGDIRQATHLLDVLNLEEPGPTEVPRIAFVEGRLLELAGDFEGAVAKWEEVELSPHRPSQVEATVARTELLLKLEKITRAEAIDEFEKLRFRWRGDEFEFSLLRRLGHLYLEEKDFRNGLRTLRQAATYFREYPESKDVTQEMTDAFAQLYLAGAADVLPPVTAIALYDEFKELTPPGEKGDEMIRKLADRLVAVDLLDRGAELLNDQIEFRLKGEQKGRVGAQLALIRIIANQPEQAMAALQQSAVPGISQTLTTQRRHLQARAMIQMGQAEQAVALLEDDESLDAERLRTEVFWDAQDWPKAGQSLARQLKTMGIKAKVPLDEKQATMVLNYAVALTLAGNERALQRVRLDHLASMDAGPYRDAFRLITSPPEEGVMEIQKVAAKVTDAENFRSFLSTYRERLKKENLSELFAGPSPNLTAG